jgi:hypothetical protein
LSWWSENENALLGIPGKHTYYEVTGPPCNDLTRIYYVGLLAQNSCDSTFDPVTYQTLLRVYNWDAATAGIRDASGYAASDIPLSYYLTSKPAYFGNLKWPPVDPANPAYSMSRTNIPAAYRFITGVDPTPGSRAPDSPQGLRVIVP